MKMRGEISVRYQGKRSYIRSAGVWVGVEKVCVSAEVMEVGRARGRYVGGLDVGRKGWGSG